MSSCSTVFLPETVSFREMVYGLRCSLNVLFFSFASSLASSCIQFFDEYFFIITNSNIFYWKYLLFVNLFGNILNNFFYNKGALLHNNISLFCKAPSFFLHLFHIFLRPPILFYHQRLHLLCLHLRLYISLNKSTSIRFCLP